MTENVTFPYNTAMSEADAKTNRIRSIKLTYNKDQIFALSYFIFLKI